MSTMHEHVHQRASQQQQEWQGPKEVGTVFAQQKICSDCAEYEQTECVSRAPERRRNVLTRPLSS
jgi:hypothetical protein